MVDILPFLIIIMAGLVFSEFFNRLHLPYVTALIVAGVVIGPYFLNIIELNETTAFIGSIGVVFLMFIAGSEVKIDSFKAVGKGVFIISLLNGSIPFLVGLGIGWYFGFSLFTSVVLGTIFVSSSIAVIIPSLESSKLINTRVGKSIISSTVFEDIGSLLLLAIILQSFAQRTPLPLSIYIPTIILVIFFLKAVVPALGKIYHANKRGGDLFESELRFVFVVLLTTVLLFEFLGMHSIIAGFFIGIILGDSIKGKIEEKIRTISYGIFIPTFFLTIGMQTDLSVFLTGTSVELTVFIVIGLIASKIISGFIGGTLANFSKKESILIGVSTIPQLSTTLAAAFAALEFGLLKNDIIVSLIVLSVITTFLAPILIDLVSKNILPEKIPGKL
jgi:Kef-type K+ transport system membrane component KefB